MYKTMEEIREEYDGQWVYMINCQENERGSVVGGVVLIHSGNRQDFFSALHDADTGETFTFFGYLGNVPDRIGLIQ